MFTSDINKKGIRSGMILTFVILLFGAIYEHFSFGVYSGYMIYAFVPILTETAFLMLMYEKNIDIGGSARTLLRCAGITASVGCIASGIVEIYGTENRLLKYYAIAAAVLYLAAFLKMIQKTSKYRRSAKSEVAHQTS